MKTLILLAMLAAATLHAQQNEGIWEGYDGEWLHVSHQLLQLAEATPADKFSWRPAPGVRSMSEVYMHIAVGNYVLLQPTGVKIPALSDDLETTVKTKTEVIAWLRKSDDAVTAARKQLKPGDLRRPADFGGKHITVDDLYLRILVHDSEHMGQLIAYARMNGIVPPWSK